jgi:hypothetical protein
MPTFMGARHGGGIQIPYRGTGDTFIEVFRETGTGLANAGLTFTRFSELTLLAGDSTSLGIAPFESHGDIKITNLGLQTIALRASNGAPVYLYLAPRQQGVIPAYAGAAPAFTMILENTGGGDDTAHVAVEEPYGWSLSTMSNPGTGPFFQAVLERNGDISNDGFDLLLEGQDGAPGSSFFVSVREPGATVGIEDPPSAGTPPRPRVHKPVPNPFRTETMLGFDIPRAASAEVQIYDVQGRAVRRIVENHPPVGRWAVPWDGANGGGKAMPSGVYFYRLLLDGRETAYGRVVRIP